MVQFPASVDECVYFTRRSLGSKGKVVAWVPRETCKVCSKGSMEKPRDPKTNRFKLRAKEYVCTNCKIVVPIEEYEDTLTLCALYTCPSCGKEGETKVLYRRKKVKVLNEETGKEGTADAVQFLCQFCSGKINVTKKLK
ncbi:MAG TPA: hypothetical protein VJB87_01125 [Candidatus Nanoarchaeia archaeon]|nr:hypothetical protein [Candidatus Nanoarchaeia archaeon]